MNAVKPRVESMDDAALESVCELDSWVNQSKTETNLKKKLSAIVIYMTREGAERG